MKGKVQIPDKTPFILSLLCKITKGINLPGRYWLTRQISGLYLSKVHLVRGQVGAYTVDLDLRDTIQQQVFYGIYDSNEICLVKQLLHPGDSFLDIGANIGYYSLVASQSVGQQGKVIAFEPLPNNIRLLQQTIIQNQISNIKLVPCAVGAGQGQLTLFLPDDPQVTSGWASKVPSKKRTHELTVEMTTLDEFLANNPLKNLKLIKMDIEGAELDALNGAQHLLSGPQAPDLLLEINPYLLKLQNLGPEQLLSWLQEHGYQIFQVGRGQPKAFDHTRPIVDTTNIFCTKHQV